MAGCGLRNFPLPVAEGLRGCAEIIPHWWYWGRGRTAVSIPGIYFSVITLSLK